MMKKLITGIHHISAMAGDAQENVDFYTQFLGLRLIKKTVNFDDPSAYHLYYGNETGAIGNIITFFPYPKLDAGRHGRGMINTTTFSVPMGGMDYWMKRFEEFNVAHKRLQERFDGEVYAYFEDKDGLGLELVFNDKDKRPGFRWGMVPQEFAIKGFYNVEIWADNYVRTGALLTQQLDHQLIAEKAGRFRYAATDAPGNYVDILVASDSPVGLMGTGVVHHIAFITKNTTSQLEVYNKVQGVGRHLSKVKDRKYFHSIYFREPSGVLFEVATSGPGFTVDETVENLGSSLVLPENFEWNRKGIEALLPEIKIKNDAH